MEAVIGRKFGEIWEIDEKLRQVATELVTEFSEDLGHIDLEHVVFLRMTGLKNAKWLGKCFYIKEPYNIIPKVCLAWMGKHGLQDEKKFQDFLEMGNLDLRYIIAVNDDLVGSVSDDQESVVRALLHHELKHIKSEMDGIEDHDTKDFKAILSRYGVFWGNGVFKTESDTGEGEQS